MSASAIEITKSSASIEKPSEGVNPRDIRWGFQMSQREKIMSAYECGIARVPFGRFFAIETLEVPRENHTIDWTQPKDKTVLIAAAEAENYLMQALGGTGAQSRVNWGLKTAFHNEKSAAKMAVISSVLLPTLPQIREISADLRIHTISEACEGSDDLDFGIRDTCVTCWWTWLNSPAVERYIENMALTGMAVHERDPNTGLVTQGVVTPTVDEMKVALAVMIEAGRLGVRQLQTQWTQISAEYESENVRKDILEIEHGYRKDLHQNKPQDRQFALAREIAKSTQGIAAPDNSDILRMMAESQAQTNALLAQMAASQASGTNTVPISVPEGVVSQEPAAAKKTKEK